MRWGRVCVVATLNFAALQASAALGEAQEPQAPARASRYDSIQLRPRTGAGETRSGNAGAPVSGAMEASRVLGALGAVIALIFAVRWAGRRFLGMNSVRNGGGGAVRVLSKTVLSPKQQLMLVQVGKRIVLVANTGVQMNALCEISDPEEVTALVSEVQARPERPVGAASFLSAFGRAGDSFPDDVRLVRDAKAAEREEDEHSVVPPTRAELAGLLEKVRLMSGSFRKG
jgi:flagellar protein FliO/FliZ